jgi:hypothetical protein
VTKVAGLELLTNLRELTLRSSLISKMEGLGTLTGMQGREKGWMAG